MLERHTRAQIEKLIKVNARVSREARLIRGGRAKAAADRTREILIGVLRERNFALRMQPSADP